VLSDGSLVIERVVSGDAGEYVCEAQSPAGSAFAKAELSVRGEKNQADATNIRYSLSLPLPSRINGLSRGFSSLLALFLVTVSIPNQIELIWNLEL